MDEIIDYNLKVTVKAADRFLRQSRNLKYVYFIITYIRL